MAPESHTGDEPNERRGLGLAQDGTVYAAVGGGIAPPHPDPILVQNGAPVLDAFGNVTGCPPSPLLRQPMRQALSRAVPVQVPSQAPPRRPRGLP